MTEEIADLYQELILDHHAHPHNFGVLPTSTQQAEGVNPLCGDACTIYLQVEDERLRDISFTGSGCAISRASASLMTDYVKGKSLEEIKEDFQHFHQLLVGGSAKSPEEDSAKMAAFKHKLGKLEALLGVREFPMRVKCATLAWHALIAALEQPNGRVSTE